MNASEFSSASFPLAYLITICCYGTHLPGHPGGSVDRRRNQYGSDYLESNPTLERTLHRRLVQEPYRMDRCRREIVLSAIRESCLRHEWSLRAAQVRSTHLHAVVEANQEPDAILKAFKAQASRALNQGGLDPPNRKRWSRKGSRRYLWDPKSVAGAIDYVLNCQGKPMSVFPHPRDSLE